MPSVARLAARTGPVRAVTGTADPRYVPAANAPARQSVGAEPHAHAPPPTMRARHRPTPPVVQTGAVDANQRAHPRPLRYLMVPYAGAFPQRQPQALPTAPPLPTSPR
jgi:hypothetical protein